MASILDIGFLQNFSILFPFLLVLVLVYAILSMSILKERRALAGMIAFLLAIMTLFSQVVIDIIGRMTPILVVFFIIIIFMLMAFGIFGVKPETLLSSGPYHKHIGWWTFIILLLILIGSITSVFSERGGVPGPGATGPYIGNETQLVGTGAEGTQQGAFFQTLFNTKVLGMIVVLLIAMIAIQRLTIEE
ncbi:hypothetical protein J4410_02170 [Candidatus Woesearchaeota archaeon]|nr:hypothetical protein [Candidatus Woesearchaeota archaeon]